MFQTQARIYSTQGDFKPVLMLETKEIPIGCNRGRLECPDEDKDSIRDKKSIQILEWTLCDMVSGL